MEKQKEALNRAIKEGSKSTDYSIICESSLAWREVSENQWQAEVTINCFRVSDSSVVRPPAGTKPPAGRVASGTVTQSGCESDPIKK
jgi:isoleucyl-tRNA synthetase